MRYIFINIRTKKKVIRKKIIKGFEKIFIKGPTKI